MYPEESMHRDALCTAVGSLDPPLKEEESLGGVWSKRAGPE